MSSRPPRRLIDVPTWERTVASWPQKPSKNWPSSIEELHTQNSELESNRVTLDEDGSATATCFRRCPMVT